MPLAMDDSWLGGAGAQRLVRTPCVVALKPPPNRGVYPVKGFPYMAIRPPPAIWRGKFPIAWVL